MIFESIIKNARPSFGLGGNAESPVSSLLGFNSNPANGGFAGFVESSAKPDWETP